MTQIYADELMQENCLTQGGAEARRRQWEGARVGVTYGCVTDSAGCSFFCPQRRGPLRSGILRSCQREASCPKNGHSQAWRVRDGLAVGLLGTHGQMRTLDRPTRDFKEAAQSVTHTRHG